MVVYFKTMEYLSSGFHGEVERERKQLKFIPVIGHEGL
jgi:hypothetical protein